MDMAGRADVERFGRVARRRPAPRLPTSSETPPQFGIEVIPGAR